MRRRSAALGGIVCVYVALSAAPAPGACPGLHEIEDMVAAGVTSRTIRAVFEETGWADCLSDEDLARLRDAGLGEGLVAFLEARAQPAIASAEGEQTEAAATYPGSPYVAEPYGPRYPYVYPYGYGGLFLGGGGFHHHHHDRFLGHDWADPDHHFGLGSLAHPGFHLGSLSGGHIETHSLGHSGPHAMHGPMAAHGGHVGHAGHGGHGGPGGH